ncbi:hypothetical protein AGMMS50262_18470 [Bacteroidia bacterium]|nr:hypothetical protein AGMMS50262_18470 [Bacteroidia bacterium]
MKRFAAHYVFLPPDNLYKLHCVELDDGNRLQDIFPLTEEIASTTFYNGTLLVLKAKDDFSEVKKNDTVSLFHCAQFENIM